MPFLASITPGRLDGNHHVAQKVREVLKLPVARDHKGIRSTQPRRFSPRKRQDVGSFILTAIRGIQFSDGAIVYEADVELLLPKPQPPPEAPNEWH
jgi:hypothetical protein